MKALKTCPHCGGYYERMIDGGCPQCKRPISRRKYGPTPSRKRTCPQCSKIFTRAKTISGNKTCPQCKTPIHYMKSGETILLSDKEAASEVVDVLQAHVSKTRNASFEFTPSERARELTHAYVILQFAQQEKSKLGLSISPGQLAVEYVEKALTNGYHKSDSLVVIRGNLAKISNRVGKQVKSTEQVNAAMESAVNYSGFMVQ